MSKYKKHFQNMVSENQFVFDEFKSIHDLFAHKDTSVEILFHEKGTLIHRIIRRYENALCSKSETSGYSKFSSNLSDKFWEEVRSYFPLIDKVHLQ